MKNALFFVCAFIIINKKNIKNMQNFGIDEIFIQIC